MNYGVKILSKYPAQAYEVELESNMGRSLLYLNLNVNNINCAIGTVHLESLFNNAPLRKI